MKRKTLISVISAVVIACCVIGGTLSYLTDKTQNIKNTFTVGDVNITLVETATDFKMVPGNDIAKDPKITVAAGSVDCWLFVKIEKSTNLDTFISFELADGWTALEGESGVYYREVASAQTDTVFGVLKGDKVSVKTTVTKQMLNELTSTTNPTLTFTAYAAQKENITSAATAWDLF